MKDKKFLELLNLYIDSEATPEERELFEAEIAANPKRRSLYFEHSRLYHASRAAAEKFHNRIVGPLSLDEFVEQRNILAQSRQRTRRRLSAFAGGTAAACFLVLAVFPISFEQDSLSEVDAAGVEPQTLVADSAATPAEEQSTPGRTDPSHAPESRTPFHFSAASFALIESQARSGTIGPWMEPTDRVPFQVILQQNSIEENLRLHNRTRDAFPGTASDRIYHSQSSFESPSPELTSFQFRR